MIEVLEVGPERAADLLGVIHAAFAGRPVLDPPATALDETVDSVREVLAGHGGLLAVAEGVPIGGLLFGEQDGLLRLGRVGVVPAARRTGTASLLADRAADVAARRGRRGMVLTARAELPATVGFWAGHGFVVVGREGPLLTMARLLPLTVRLPEDPDTRALGERLGALVRAGDLVILTGDLGAGKTTLTQGLGRALDVRGQVTSPTFVISRVHPPLGDGPPLVHVDAYRLGGTAELDDLDLDTDVEDAVTVVEWGEGLAETLAADRLEIRLERAADDVRTATLTPVGVRWVGVDLGPLVAAP